MTVVASGGDVTIIDGYKIHTFRNSGTLTVYTAGDAELLAVAGGGGGGNGLSGSWEGGGGGAGGLIYNAALPLGVGSIDITIGGGGASLTNGENTIVTDGNVSFSTQTAIGGGNGGGGLGGGTPVGAGNGGSGGGSSSGGSGGTGTVGQGNAGGNGSIDAGGGGGAGAVGQDYSPGVGGNGGVGLAYSISGASAYYAGGGGGADNTPPGGTGGLGGGGDAYSDATPNTGGGGGGGRSNTSQAGGTGGSGVVIFRYAITLASVRRVAENEDLADMAQARFKGRKAAAGTGIPQDMTAAEAITALGGPFVSPVSPSVVDNVVTFADITGGQKDSGIAASDVSSAVSLKHAAITLDTNADTLLSLSTQALGLDTQAAHKVLIGRVDAGADLVPTFRALDAADLPATYLTAVTASAPLTGAGTGASHLSIPAATAATDGYATSEQITKLDAIVGVPGVTSTVTAAGTTTLTAASTDIQEFTGTNIQDVVLPVVSTLVLGRPFTIINNSTVAISLWSSGGTDGATVFPGTRVVAICILLTGTAIASWHVAEQGVTGQSIANVIDGATAETSLLDADEMGFWKQTVAGWRKITWANIKIALGLGTWASYTPVWSAYSGTAVSLGNGTITGKWIKSRGVVTYKIRLLWGSTTTGGDAGGLWKFTLPDTALDTASASEPGVCSVTETGVAEQGGISSKIDSTHIACIVGTAYVGATSPFAWGSGDFLTIMGQFES